MFRRKCAWQKSVRVDSHATRNRDTRYFPFLVRAADYIRRILTERFNITGRFGISEEVVLANQPLLFERVIRG